MGRRNRMKTLAAVVMVGVILLLTGCGPLPDRDIDGMPWQDSWVDVGIKLGIEPVEGLELLEQSDALAMSGISYAAWSAGEKTEYENSEGVTGDLYDLQVFVLLQNCKTESEAASTREQWRAMEEQHYTMTALEDASYGGHEYSCWSLVPTDESPYGCGYIGLLTFGYYSLSVELMVRADFTPEYPAGELFQDFLAAIHYRAEE